MAIHTLLEGIPPLREADIARRPQFASYYTLVLLRSGPAPRDDEAQNERLKRENLQHLFTLQMLGELVLNGPILSDHKVVGASVYTAAVDEARALAEADPKVLAGYLTVETLQWMALPSAVPSATDD